MLSPASPLKGLQGAERQRYIEEFRKQHQGQMFVALHLHNHQPIYRPGTHPADTPEIKDYVLGGGDAENRREVYTSADAYAIESTPGQAQVGFQVSYSGSLMQNLDKTAEKGLWPGGGWNQRYRNVRQQQTPLDHARLDLVNFGYHHPLMGLIASGHADGKVNSDKDTQLQVAMHQQAVLDHFGGPLSQGFFPPEMAWSERMIPVLQERGIQWTLVDNVHLDRARQAYNNPGDGLKAPNRADQRNPASTAYQSLANDLAKQSQVSPEALRPHYQKFVNPTTGEESLMVVVPQERSLSSYIQKDRNGGRLQEVLEKFQSANTDPNHPMLVVLASDGDNNGSNSGQFHREVPLDLAGRFPGKVSLITIEDYLEIYPPEKPQEVIQADGTRRYQGGDVIHVEDGAWWGANLGDPEYSKWIDDPAMRSFSPKNNSWAVLTAAKNAVLTADSLEPAGQSPESLRNIANLQGSDSERAWGGLLTGQTSCYEYWNADNVLSYSSVKGANLAVEASQKVLERHPVAADKVGPSIFLPRHTPYNPGGKPGQFEVMTYVYDVNAVDSVKVRYRIDEDGKLVRNQDFRYEGEGVTAWSGEASMHNEPFPDLPNKPAVWVDPKARAEVYRSQLRVPGGSMVQYYVEATDKLGNLSRSPIRNVFVSKEGEALSNDELHNRMKSGDPARMADAMAYVLSSGRKDVHLFNHLFFRLEENQPGLYDQLDQSVVDERLQLSPDPDFRKEYIQRLDQHLEEASHVEPLKAHPTLRDALIADLDPKDPAVGRIRTHLGLQG